MLICWRESGAISSSHCYHATPPEALRMRTLFCIAYGKVITATLSLALPVDSAIRFTHNFILETEVREVYGLSLSEIVKQIQIELTIGPPRHQRHPAPLCCY